MVKIIPITTGEVANIWHQHHEPPSGPQNSVALFQCGDKFDFVGKMLKEIRRKDNVDRARGELGNGAARSHDGLSSFDEVLDVGVEVDRDSLSALDYIDEFTTPGAEVNDHVCGINESLKVGTNEDFPHAALKRKLVVGETFSVELSEFIAV